MGFDTFGCFRGWCTRASSCLEYCASGEPTDAADTTPLRCSKCRCLPQAHVPARAKGYDPNSPEQLAALQAAKDKVAALKKDKAPKRAEGSSLLSEPSGTEMAQPKINHNTSSAAMVGGYKQGSTAAAHGGGGGGLNSTTI